MNGSPASDVPPPASLNNSAQPPAPQTIIAMPTPPVAIDAGGSAVAYTKFVHAAFVAQGLLDLDTKVNPYGIEVDWDDPSRGFPITMFVSLPHLEQVRGIDKLKFLTAAAICIVEPAQAFQRLKQHLSTDALARLLSESPSKMRKELRDQIVQCMPVVLVDSFVVAAAVPSLLLDFGASRPALAYQVLVDLFLVPLVGIHRRLGVNQLSIYSGKVNGIRPDKVSVDGDLFKFMKKILGAPRQGMATELKVVDTTESNYPILSLARFFTWALHRLHNDNDPVWIDKIKTAFKK